MLNEPCFRRPISPTLCVIASTVLFAASQVHGQASAESRSWNQPVKPYHLIGNIYYVGASEVTSFLITTPEGHILLDSGYAETLPQIKANVRELGFNLREIKILLNSHAHLDHCGGIAILKALTGAQLIASAADAELLTRGGLGDFHFGNELSYAPVKTDRVLSDGEEVRLGGVTMTAHLTPGHTKGCTTWTMKVTEEGHVYDVVFVGSASIPGYKLVNNQQYPEITKDYARTFRTLKTLPCDVFLASHGSFFSMTEKARLLAEHKTPNPFIDPQGYKNFVARSEKEFQQQLAREQKPTGADIPPR
ncbi:MAG: subclass B3 metallo-beta-lactamase [Verrucomicrobiota bacterium]